MTFQRGDEKDIMNSIKNKLLVFPEDTVIYPGHGEVGIISEERPLYL
ncbi:MAG: MBL fold metallo-hydrolase [Clostridia bacterium]|nr:MBL fold metallo-hydrolase [Clostridia bacterium]